MSLLDEQNISEIAIRTSKYSNKAMFQQNNQTINHRISQKAIKQTKLFVQICYNIVSMFLLFTRRTQTHFIWGDDFDSLTLNLKFYPFEFTSTGQKIFTFAQLKWKNVSI